MNEANLRRGTDLNRIAINRAYLGQPVTGQQRYAAQIVNELLAVGETRLIDPPSSLGRAGSWAWVQGPAMSVNREEVLLSLTSRAPFAHRRHVVTVHDLFVLTNPEWYTRRYVLTHAPILRHHLRFASALVAVSEPTRVHIEEYTNGKAVCVVAANGSSHLSSAAGPTPLSQPNRWGLAPANYLLCVGSLEPRKNLRLLARAYGQLNPVQRIACPLVVVGGTSGSVFRSYDIDWPEETILTGYVSDTELQSLYGSATAVVVPSLDEGFGLPVVEAALARVPLILSDIPVFRWVYGHGALYFDPTDYEDLRARLEQTILTVRQPRGPEIEDKAIELETRFSWAESAGSILGMVASL